MIEQFRFSKRLTLLNEHLGCLETAGARHIDLSLPPSRRRSKAAGRILVTCCTCAIFLRRKHLVDPSGFPSSRSTCPSYNPRDLACAVSAPAPAGRRAWSHDARGPCESNVISRSPLRLFRPNKTRSGTRAVLLSPPPPVAVYQTPWLASASNTSKQKINNINDRSWPRKGCRPLAPAFTGASTEKGVCDIP